MTDKRILFNLNTFPIVGNTVPLLEKMSYWKQNGYEVTIFASGELAEMLNATLSGSPFKSIEIVSRSESTNKIRFMIECLRRNLVSIGYLRRIEDEKFPIVYTISSVLDLIFIPLVLKTRKNKFIWLTVFDNTVPLSGAGNKIIRFLNWFFFIISSRLIRKADRIFAPSDNMLAYLKEKKFSPTQIVSTGNGVEIEMIQKAKTISDLEIDALYIGRIHEAKGIYELLRVLSLVVERFPNFKLGIMGDGESETVRKFNSKIQEMNLTNNILFLGYKSGQEKYDIIKSSKCFWFFSESEGFPQALMEAVSSGLVCFVYHLSAYDYYKNNELRVFAQKDYKSVAAAVIDLFDKRDFNNKAGRALLENFSWEKVAQTELKSIN